MLSLLRPYVYPALVGLVLCAATYIYGYQLGHGNARLACETARAEAERQVAVALAELAHRAAQANAEADRLRTETRSVAGEVTRERDDAFSKLPPSTCVVDEPRRVLLNGTYCARFPSAPSCLSDTLR